MKIIISNSHGTSIHFDSEQSAIDFFGLIEYTAIKNGSHSEFNYMEV